MIHVTETYLPEMDTYRHYLQHLFQSRWLTNNGELVQELTARLEAYLGVRNLVLVANGTLALQIAYRLLEFRGEVVTTPFSFAATSGALVWEGVQPVFSDIDPRSYTLDPARIESLIGPKTTGIVPVHIFGNACDVDAIESIARRHGLGLVYDAAQAFGSTYRGESLLNRGDISVVSFHATKLFHTIEGGALVIKDDALYEQAKLMINFGIDGPDSVKTLGINAKMNEFEAAMGLSILDDMPTVIAKQQAIYERYWQALHLYVTFQQMHSDSVMAHAYAPVLFGSHDEMLGVQAALYRSGIDTRRYFFPSLDTLEFMGSEQVCPMSRDIADRILCLPTFFRLETTTQEQIIAIVKASLEGRMAVKGSVTN